MWPSLAVLAVLVATTSAVDPTTVLSQADQSRLKALFKSSDNLRNVESAHFAAGGLKLLGESPDQVALLEVSWERSFTARLPAASAFFGYPGFTGHLPGRAEACRCQEFGVRVPRCQCSSISWKLQGGGRFPCNLDCRRLVIIACRPDCRLTCPTPTAFWLLAVMWMLPLCITLWLHEKP